MGKQPFRIIEAEVEASLVFQHLAVEINLGRLRDAADESSQRLEGRLGAGSLRMPQHAREHDRHQDRTAALPRKVPQHLDATDERLIEVFGHELLELGSNPCMANGSRSLRSSPSRIVEVKSPTSFAMSA